MTVSGLITEECASVVTAERASIILFIFLVHIGQVGWSIITNLLDEGGVEA